MGIRYSRGHDGEWRGNESGTKVPLLQGSDVAYLRKVGTQKKPGVPCKFLLATIPKCSIVYWRPS